MPRLLVSLGAVAAMALAAPGLAQELRATPNVSSDLLRLDTSQNSAERLETKTYIVQLSGDPAVAYKGGVSGFAATAPDAGARYNSRASHVEQYVNHLISSHDRMLSTVGAGDRKLYSYCHTFNGFAARLTAAEADTLRGNKSVLNVWEDQAIEVETNNSPTFLGLLDPVEGLRTRGLRGDDVIVGVLDTGAVQEHPSFADTKAFKKGTRVVYSDPPERWNGICQAGEAWAETDCNNKLIGARWFVDGFIAGTGGVVEEEFLSPRDSSGHGSHTASTAAGNEVTASLVGVPLAQISGMAPRARVAVYKVCWLAPGATNFSCFFSDSAAATDAAVADGVDVLNFSVGTAAAFNDPQDIAFLNAASAGVFIARSGGNSGPGAATINAGEPWVTSVAASTLDGTAFALAITINAPASVAGEYSALEGSITAPLIETGPITDDLLAADPIDACGAGLSNDIGGQIALIARGTCTFVEKIENAVNAGASAVIVYSDSRPKTVMGGTASDLTRSVPGVMIDNADGLALLAELQANNTVNATLEAANFIPEPLDGNIMAGFSSRGPYVTESDWIKPDITAPGVRILAAHTPEPSDGSAGDFFQYLQGTSMSSPHIAGLGALVIQAHRGWSPAAVKSALMTTARQDVVKEDGATPADPFDFGAGHVDPNGAVDPGLVYDADLFDYLAVSCGTVTPLISAADCDFLASVGFSLDPADLNLPSIGIGELPGTKTIKRTVTNVGERRGASVYHVEVDAPEGFKVEVSPQQLLVGHKKTASYEVTITNQTAPPGEWRFGSLTWRDGEGHEVRSPIAVNAIAIVAPPEVSGEGAAGTADFDITFGYTGDYTAGVHGLADAFLTLGTVEDDPGNSFQFLGPGTTIAFIADLPAGTAFARWSLFNEYTSGNDDLDLYLFYCPNFLCTQIDSSGNPDSNEEVSVTLPVTDESIDDPYVIFVHGFNTEGGTPADFIQFDWNFGVVDDRGNMTVTAPSSATIGETETVTVDWTGLLTGPGAKQLGAVSHSDASAIQALTLISIQNDAGAGLCDLVECP